MRRRSKLLLALFLPLLAWGQNVPKARTAPEVGGFIFRAETRLVVLHATVVDQIGRAHV